MKKETIEDFIKRGGTIKKASFESSYKKWTGYGSRTRTKNNLKIKKEDKHVSR